MSFKFDVRIRARLLANQTLAEADLAKHMAGLVDLDSHATNIDVPQPAIGTAEERRSASELRAAIRASAAPRSIPPPPLAVDAGWGDDDEDDVEAPAKSAEPGEKAGEEE